LFECRELAIDWIVEWLADDTRPIDVRT